MSNHRLRGVLAAIAVSAVVLVAVGCGNDNKNDSTAASTATTTTTAAAPSDTVGVKASEMKFVLTSDTAPAGKVTFNAENVGKVDHEMVVIKTATLAADLPVTDGKVSEEGSIGEIGPEELKVGATVSKSFDMKAGHYALICALPGHYQAGMYSDLTVE